MIAMDFPNAVTNASNFYNRRDELEKACRALTADTRLPVIIIGERRLGKTSLQNVAMEAITAADSRSCMIFVDPRSCPTVDLFADAVIRRLTAKTKCEISDIGLVGESGRFQFESVDQFLLVVSSILPRETEETFILCVDEFDEMVRLAAKNGAAEKDRLFTLIHQLMERPALPLRLFFTMTRIPDPQQADYPAWLISESEIIELSPLDQQTTQGMIDWLMEGRDFHLSSTAKNALSTLSGGHPYFIKLLLANLLEVTLPSHGQEISAADIWNNVLPKAMDDARARYAIENIYKAQFNLDEKKVLLYMAERGDPVRAEEVRAAGSAVMGAVRSLTSRHYLNETAEGYSMRIRFLDYWFRNWLEFEEELERLNVHLMTGINL
jgi:hypothetical protein